MIAKAIRTKAGYSTPVKLYTQLGESLLNSAAIFTKPIYLRESLFMESAQSSQFARAGFRRRFGSWIYDLLIVVAIYMLSGYICVALFVFLDSLGLMSLVRSDFDIDWQATHVGYQIAFNAWALAWVCGFFLYFWCKKGQTLGMRAWRLRVQNTDGSLICVSTGIKRLMFTLLGLGNLLVIVDRKNKLSLQDRLTNSEVVLLSLEANRGRL